MGVVELIRQEQGLVENVYFVAKQLRLDAEVGG